MSFAKKIQELDQKARQEQLKKQEKEEHKLDTLYKMSVQAELEDLYERVSTLQHQVKVYEDQEQVRLQESEDYRLKLVVEDLKEQQRVADLEPTPLLLTRGAHIGTTPLPFIKNMITKGVFQ